MRRRARRRQTGWCRGPQSFRAVGPPAYPSYPSSPPPPFLARYHQVLKAIWSALDLPGRSWRSIFKALTLLDHLVKNGAERVVEEVREGGKEGGHVK